MRSVYVIIENLKTGNLTLYRYDEDKWNEESQDIYKPKIRYVTYDVNDEEIKKYNFEYIIWDKVFNTINKNNENIKIKYNPENILQMEKEAFEIKEKKMEYMKAEKIHINEHRNEKILKRKASEEYQNNIQKLVDERKIVDKIFEGCTDEMETLRLWKEKEFIKPIPTKIMEIKKSYGKMTWKEFYNLIDNLIK